MKTFWISFTSVRRSPSDPPAKNKGCVIIDAEDATGAINAATMHGLNPGGEAVAWELKEPERRDAFIASFGKKRLIPIEEIERVTGVTRAERRLTHNSRKQADLVVCECCNGIHKN